MRCLRYYTLLCGYLPEVSAVPVEGWASILNVIMAQRPSKEVVELLKELSYRFVAIEAGRKGKADGLAPATMFCLLHLPTAKLAAGPFSKELAEEATDPRVRIELIQCVADMYRVWGDRLDVVDERTGKAWTRLDWTNYWVHVLENTTDPEALAMLAQALIKITWDRRELVGARQMMKNLVVLYAVHATGNNQALIQPLQFFLRSYSHSGAVRQDVVREVFLDAYIYTCELYHEDSVHQKPLSPDALINCYLDWTDSSRVIRTDSDTV
ncbi:nuclear condensing complex subunit [Trametes elegans]|nr:nuclear condensing complex subunit [Trametes elegans]